MKRIAVYHTAGEGFIRPQRRELVLVESSPGKNPSTDEKLSAAQRSEVDQITAQSEAFIAVAKMT